LDYPAEIALVQAGPIGPGNLQENVYHPCSLLTPLNTPNINERNGYGHDLRPGRGLPGYAGSLDIWVWGSIGRGSVAFALCIPIEVSAPLAVLLSITVAGVALAQDWQKVHVRSASWMVGATLFGIPLGVVLLTRLNPFHAKAALGALILLFSIYSLVGRRPIHLTRDSRAGLLVCGFFAGVLGGAYGLNGPPLVVYASMRRWSAQHFRATLQAYFLPASLITAIGYALAGLLSRSVTRYYLLSLVPALVAILLGRALVVGFKVTHFLSTFTSALRRSACFC
jgi:uncharacterized membrane protein YfcA